MARGAFPLRPGANGQRIHSATGRSYPDAKKYSAMPGCNYIRRRRPHQGRVIRWRCTPPPSCSLPFSPRICSINSLTFAAPLANQGPRWLMSAIGKNASSILPGKHLLLPTRYRGQKQAQR